MNFKKILSLGSKADMKSSASSGSDTVPSGTSIDSLSVPDNVAVFGVGGKKPASGLFALGGMDDSSDDDWSDSEPTPATRPSQPPMLSYSGAPGGSFSMRDPMLDDFDDDIKPTPPPQSVVPSASAPPKPSFTGAPGYSMRDPLLDDDFDDAPVSLPAQTTSTTFATAGVNPTPSLPPGPSAPPPQRPIPTAPVPPTTRPSAPPAPRPPASTASAGTAPTSAPPLGDPYQVMTREDIELAQLLEAQGLLPPGASQVNAGLLGVKNHSLLTPVNSSTVVPDASFPPPPPPPERRKKRSSSNTSSPTGPTKPVPTFGASAPIAPVATDRTATAPPSVLPSAPPPRRRLSTSSVTFGPGTKGEPEPHLSTAFAAPSSIVEPAPVSSFAEKSLSSIVHPSIPSGSAANNLPAAAAASVGTATKAKQEYSAATAAVLARLKAARAGAASPSTGTSATNSAGSANTVIRSRAASVSSMSQVHSAQSHISDTSHVLSSNQRRKEDSHISSLLREFSDESASETEVVTGANRSLAEGKSPASPIAFDVASTIKLAPSAYAPAPSFAAELYAQPPPQAEGQASPAQAKAQTNVAKLNLQDLTSAMGAQDSEKSGPFPKGPEGMFMPYPPQFFAEYSQYYQNMQNMQMPGTFPPFGPYPSPFMPSPMHPMSLAQDQYIQAKLMSSMYLPPGTGSLTPPTAQAQPQTDGREGALPLSSHSASQSQVQSSTQQAAASSQFETTRTPYPVSALTVQVDYEKSRKQAESLRTLQAQREALAQRLQNSQGPGLSSTPSTTPTSDPLSPSIHTNVSSSPFRSISTSSQQQHQQQQLQHTPLRPAQSSAVHYRTASKTTPLYGGPDRRLESELRGVLQRELGFSLRQEAVKSPSSASALTLVPERRSRRSVSLGSPLDQDALDAIALTSDSAGSTEAAKNIESPFVSGPVLSRLTITADIPGLSDSIAQLAKQSAETVHPVLAGTTQATLVKYTAEAFFSAALPEEPAVSQSTLPPLASLAKDPNLESLLTAPLTSVHPTLLLPLLETLRLLPVNTTKVPHPALQLVSYTPLITPLGAPDAPPLLGASQELFVEAAIEAGASFPSLRPHVRFDARQKLARLQVVEALAAQALLQPDSYGQKPGLNARSSMTFAQTQLLHTNHIHCPAQLTWTTLEACGPDQSLALSDLEFTYPTGFVPLHSIQNISYKQNNETEHEIHLDISYPVPLSLLLKVGTASVNGSEPSLHSLPVYPTIFEKAGALLIASSLTHSIPPLATHIHLLLSVAYQFPSEKIAMDWAQGLAVKRDVQYVAMSSLVRLPDTIPPLAEGVALPSYKAPSQRQNVASQLAQQEQRYEDSEAPLDLNTMASHERETRQLPALLQPSELAAAEKQLQDALSAVQQVSQLVTNLVSRPASPSVPSRPAPTLPSVPSRAPSPAPIASLQTSIGSPTAPSTTTARERSNSNLGPSLYSRPAFTLIPLRAPTSSAATESHPPVPVSSYPSFSTASPMSTYREPVAYASETNFPSIPRTQIPFGGEAGSRHRSEPSWFVQDAGYPHSSVPSVPPSTTIAPTFAHSQAAPMLMTRTQPLYAPHVTGVSTTTSTPSYPSNPSIPRRDSIPNLSTASAPRIHAAVGNVYPPALPVLPNTVRAHSIGFAGTQSAIQASFSASLHAARAVAPSSNTRPETIPSFMQQQPSQQQPRVPPYANASGPMAPPVPLSMSYTPATGFYSSSNSMNTAPFSSSSMRSEPLHGLSTPVASRVHSNAFPVPTRDGVSSHSLPSVAIASPLVHTPAKDPMMSRSGAMHPSMLVSSRARM